jgi:uncharacterized protein (TIGR02118 family)
VIKRLTAWYVRSEVDAQDALAHWRSHHAELVRAVPGLRRYVQNYCTVGPSGDAGERPAWTGLGEVWFDDESAAHAAMATPEWRTVMEDAATFMDLQRITATWAEERVFES